MVRKQGIFILAFAFEYFIISFVIRWELEKLRAKGASDLPVLAK